MSKCDFSFFFCWHYLCPNNKSLVDKNFYFKLFLINFLSSDKNLTKPNQLKHKISKLKCLYFHVYCCHLKRFIFSKG